MPLETKLIIRILMLFFWFYTSCTTDVEEIRVLEAARQYASQNTDVEVNLQAESVLDEYARVRVTPKNEGESDEALMYLKKDKGLWQGVALGTGFTPEEYEELGIPENIR